jgi:sulfite dehydrogenase (cytochrome) subunit A
VRSFILSPTSGERVAAGRMTVVKGFAFDSGYGISDVVISSDAGTTWKSAQLGPELSRYSFRQWSFEWTPPARGSYQLMARATNRMGESQPLEALWNPAGYMRNVVEHVEVSAE